MLLPRYDIFAVADEVIKIFNLFVTYGDTFLPNPITYDELYYELIRVHKVFDDFHALGEYYSSILLSFWLIKFPLLVIRRVSSGQLTSHLLESGNRVLSNIVNIRSISAHFSPKIDAWTKSHDIVSVTPDQVLHIRTVM